MRWVSSTIRMPLLSMRTSCTPRVRISWGLDITSSSSTDRWEQFNWAVPNNRTRNPTWKTSHLSAEPRTPSWSPSSSVFSTSCPSTRTTYWRCIRIGAKIMKHLSYLLLGIPLEISWPHSTPFKSSTRDPISKRQCVSAWKSTSLCKKSRSSRSSCSISTCPINLIRPSSKQKIWT